jgi:IclR family pca regulon transcriptional regulator
MSEDNPNHRIYTIGGLLRGLALLEELVAVGRPMKLADIAKRLGLTRGVTFRLIYTLKEAGFLQETGEKIYQPGPRVLSLGFSYLRSLGLVRLARPHLEALSEATQSAVFLAVLDGRDIVYLDKALVRGQATLDIDVGDRVPAHSTAMGRVLLAGLTDHELSALYGDAELPAHRQQPSMTLAALKADLTVIRRRGWAASYSSLYKGIASLAAPVFGNDGHVVACINSTVLEGVVNRKTLEGPIRAQVLAEAAALSSALGHMPAKGTAKAAGEA